MKTIHINKSPGNYGLTKEFYGDFWDEIKEMFNVSVTEAKNKAFFYKQGLRPATLYKKRLWHRCFPVNFAKYLRTHFVQSTSGRLLLNSFISSFREAKKCSL